MTTTTTSNPQFAMIPYTVVKAGLSAKALAVYVQLVRFAGSDTTAFPSRATLAEAVGIKKADNIDGAIKELADAGFIVVKPRWTDSKGSYSFVKDGACRMQASSIYELVPLR